MISERGSSRIRFNVPRLLEFYDDPKPEDRGHVSAITGVVGEDLGAGLLADFHTRHGRDARILPGRVTQGTRKGRRLDRWILVTEKGKTTYFQVEIKNWAASAIGGRRLPIDADGVRLRDHKIERWSKEWKGGGFIKDAVGKVLIPMLPPVEDARVEPLACFWDAMHPTGATDPYFSIASESGAFSRVWFFSMSSYLRQLADTGENTIEIYAPNATSRLRIIEQLLV